MYRKSVASKHAVALEKGSRAFYGSEQHTQEVKTLQVILGRGAGVDLDLSFRSLIPI